MAYYWRRHLVTKELPSRDELLPQFTKLINTITDVITGRSSTPLSLHYWFFKRVGSRVLGSSPVSFPYTVTLCRERIDSIPNLSEDDIRQQAILYLFEMWNFYKDKIKPGKKTKFVFYDYVRFNLIKYMAVWVSHQILQNTGDALAPRFSDITYMDEPDDLDFGLSWVMLKSNHGILAELSTRQKYLIYLRYTKGMTIKEIAALTQRHRALIEKDFSEINTVLGIGGHYGHSRSGS